MARKYKCGHEGEAVILDDNALSITAYLEWCDTVGFRGNNKMCWNCYCKKQDEK